ncbi:uncharacterized protein G2W53_018590 [Senna tora]|uniref:Uncharacterized protein n=1 Tax=Senna tora TaxID=362788 RepID=A0A834TVI1_9FABA|nr:uncharacterized protein G2W53_018590 [Senna tora]
MESVIQMWGFRPVKWANGHDVTI